MTRWPGPLLALGLLTVALAGCTGSDSPAPASPTPTAPSSTVAAGPTTTAFVTVTPDPSVSVIPGPTLTVTQPPTASPTTPAPTTTVAAGPAGEPPILSGVSGAATSANAAVLQWRVEDDFGGVVSKGTVTAPDGASLATAVKTGNGTFTSALGDLASCTTYQYRVDATDVGGQSARKDGSFATLRVNVTVGGLAASNVLSNQVTFNWTVGGAADVRSWIEYGTTQNYGSTSGVQTGPGGHTVTLTGLTQNQPYNVRVRATSPCGVATTGNAVHATARIIDVEIKGNSGPLSFSPNPLIVPANTLLQFRVKNSDGGAHNWNIQGEGYGSGDITGGATVLVPQSIALSPGSHVMYCTHHSGMQGTLNAQT